MSKKLLILSSFLLSFIGGFFDVYCLLYRGGKYAFLQTGNLLNIPVDIANKNYDNLILGSFLFIAFIIGLFLAYLIGYFLTKKNKEKYTHLILLVIMLLLITPNYFFPKTEGIDLSYIGIFGLGVMGGILLESFRNYYVAFTSTMMTNNCKMLVHSFLDGLLYKKNGELHKSLIYVGIIISFIIGVVLFVLLYKFNFFYQIAPLVGQVVIVFLIIIELYSLKGKGE